jgi:hypothetical protein
MYEPLKNWLLRVLRVPPEPEPPAGAPESIRVFRAGRNFFRLRLVGWGVGQFFALLGILFWFGVLREVAAEHRRSREQPPELEASSAPPPEVTDTDAPGKTRRRNRQPRNPLEQMRQVAARTPDWVFPVLWGLKVVGIGIYLGQLLLTYAARRLDYEQRWYVVTDRSLRLREGIWSVREMTMSFANLQQVVMTQGPLQRALGLADVRVESAGGGGSQTNHHGQVTHSLHIGFFHGVDCAEEIRDLILDRLRRYRETGLGDPDEKAALAARPTETPGSDNDTLAAARELLAAARELKAALKPQGS